MDQPLGVLPDEVRRESVEGQLRFLRTAVQEATAELYGGALSYREAEALARDITRVKAEITALERAIRENV